MRNFTVAFMILILFLSITFAIFKPMPAQEKTKNSDTEEKSYVEKLVTEPDATLNADNKRVPTYSNEIQSNILERDLIPIIKEQTTPQEEIQPQIKQKISNTDKIELPQKINGGYENISQELSNKYHNDPNAVVSDEDFNYYMQKLLDESNQK